MSTPHIWLQRSLAAGERLAELCDLPPGSYRLRTLEAGPQEDVTLEPGAALREIVLSGEGVGLGRGQAAHHTADGHRVGIVSCVADPATHRRLYRKIMVAHQYFAGRSEEHTSELQSLMRISYAVFF